MRARQIITKVKSRLPHFKRPKIRIRRKHILKAILVLISALLLIIIFGAFNILRHRQLCSYDQSAQQGNLVIENNTELCPNLFDTNNWPKIIQNSFNPGILASLKVSAASYLELETVQQDCQDQLNPICWVKGSKPQLKQTDGYTNLLLVGLDTRGNGTLGNTDSIMVVSVENNSGRILLTSFPRDLHVHYKRANGWSVNGKINAIYANGGINDFRYAVEQIIGKPIHYYALIRFDTFVGLVDKLGGVDINLDEKFGDVYPCGELPAGTDCPYKKWLGDAHYGYFTFPAGVNHFNSTQALVFARSRKYSSDYKRAERQQKLFKAILETALRQKLSLSDRVTSYIELYNLFNSQVKTDIGINDIAAVVALLDKLSGNVARVVADPNLDRGRILYSDGNGAAFRDKSHKQFQNFMANIWRFLPYYIELPKIQVVNTTRKPLPADSSLMKLLNNGNPFWAVDHRTSETESLGIKIYDLSGGNKAGSLRDIQKSIPGSLIYSAEIDQVKQSDFKEDILIVVGN
jgi:LCP family protein required for cell wall assembly